MRYVRLVLPALLGLLAAGCGSPGPTEPELPSAQRYLFELELANHDPRFPVYWLGLVVEADGSVSSYDRGVSTPVRCSLWWEWVSVDECSAGTLTEAQLTSRYSAKAPLVQLTAGEVTQRREQAGQLSSGPLRIPNIACNDSGVLSLVAFSHDAGTGRYRPTVIRLEGDRMGQNTAPAAGPLSDWMLALGERMSRIKTWRVWTSDCRPD